MAGGAASHRWRRSLVGLPRVVNTALAICGVPGWASAGVVLTCELNIGHRGAHRHGEVTWWLARTPLVSLGRLEDAG